MLATVPLPQLCAFALAAILHELGHVAAARVLHIDLSQIKLDVLGARLTTTGKLCSYPALVTLCLAGPLVNLLCFALTLPLCNQASMLYEFCLSSLALCLMNLIPIEGFDGGRIIHGILCSFLPITTAERICSFLSFCSLLCMWLLSVWLILRTGTSLTLFVFSCCLFGMLFA